MTVETFFTNFGYLADAPNGVQKLRELILQLAVRGKLVPQDQTDVSAEELLRNIRLSVYGKVKSGDTRKQKSEQAVAGGLVFLLLFGLPRLLLLSLSLEGKKLLDTSGEEIQLSPVDLES